MRSYHELELELLHIKAVVSLLERTQPYLSLRTPVANPAYWKARLKAIVDDLPRDAALEKRAFDLLARVHQLRTGKS
ncbi:hypothetical protein VOM14_30240 [Paraburkholderia sp. MPAMCS5]|uniref:hypothetical protein n=1 Tax=Paraburkholderia sp. MPAMCS5 TaxID=3112563 RepID=UPI002E17DC73|nr:hypothetical protein [Paraburkholderia sp. MPAMCS5]